MIDKFKAAFREEAEELLAQLENALLELESSPEDPEIINAAFRAVHTIKGSSGMFGFDAIASFAHSFENLMESVRNRRIRADKDLVGLCLKARDHIKRLLAEEGSVGDELQLLSESLAAEIKSVNEARCGVQPAPQAEVAKPVQPPRPAAAPGAQKPADAPPRQANPVATAPEDAAGAEETTYRIRLVPSPGVFRDGTKVLKLVQELAALGECTAAPTVALIPPLSEMDPELSYCRWEFILTTRANAETIKAVFMFVEDSCELAIETVMAAAAAGSARKLGEILVERGLVSTDDVNGALQSGKKLGAALVESKAVSEQDLHVALAEQEHYKKVQEKRGEPAAQTIRVASDKLDELVDLVGELVTLQARLARSAQTLEDAELGAIVEQSERLITQLRDNTMSIRMLPIGTTFSKFRRLVRDLSTELGKDVEFVAEGGDTELDKTVIERLNDPLVHILRNSMDHGIETQEVRARSGKPRKGTITVSARHSGAHVLIGVSDDGGGIDLDAVKRRGIERGLIAPGQDPTAAELHQLLFKPGFSTAQTVTNLSGRGVGMDVVKREIDTLGGGIHIESVRGAGTSMTLKIPLTLAIIDGLLVSVGSGRYVLPLSSIDACVEIYRATVEAANGRALMKYRDELLPFVDLRRFFDEPGKAPEIMQVVVVNALEAKVGVVVDQVLGDNQTVIKPLGRMFRDLEGLSGATILGDGTVALIVDVNRLAMAAYRVPAHASQAAQAAQAAHASQAEHTDKVV